MPDTEDIDPEILALSQNNRFWRMFDAAYESGEKVRLDRTRRPGLTVGASARAARWRGRGCGGLVSGGACRAFCRRGRRCLRRMRMLRSLDWRGRYLRVTG